MTAAKFDALKAMIITVAEALGDDLLQQTAFVGGITTGLLITDPYTRENVRATDDVDLITSALGYTAHAALEQTLRERGFKENPDDDVICRKRLGEIIVDFMPTDNTLGFTNRWYKDALAEAEDFALTPELTIRLLKPIHFIATKFEAWNGRGNNDVIASRDLEDIMSLIDGRESLIEEMRKGQPEILQYIAEQLTRLTAEDDYDYLLISTANGNSERAAILDKRVYAMKELAHG